MRTKAFIVAAFVAGLPVGAIAFADDADSPAVTSSGIVALSPAAAAAKATRLDELFARLKAATASDGGKEIERQIIGEWFASGDAKTDELMTTAVYAMQAEAYTVALTFLNLVVLHNPTYIEGWNKRATVYYLMKDYDKSLADVEETLKLEPRHFGALAGLGMIMIELGDKRRALTAFERAVAVDPVLDNGATVIEQLKDQIGKDI